ncbi:MAG: hypothetical protein ACLGHQ_02890 [Acidimicrobiia bacterium]
MFQLTDLKRLDPTKIDLTKIDLTKLDVRQIELPKFELPKFDLPKFPKVEVPFELPKMERPKVDLPVDRIAGFARDAAYVGVGAAVVAAKAASERRRAITDQVNQQVRRLVDAVA